MLTWREFWLAVEAWNEDQEEEWNKLRNLMAWNANIQPNFSKGKRRPIKPTDVIQLPSDKKEVKLPSLADFKKQIEKDKANWNKGKEITLDEFKDANGK